LEVSVFRNSLVSKTIPASELVVGDIYMFKTGDIIPADSVLLQSGHFHDDHIVSNKNCTTFTSCLKKSKFVICLEEDVTGNQDY
jgi:magnesium-transporting ATPase (P-type)